MSILSIFNFLIEPREGLLWIGTEMDYAWDLKNRTSVMMTIPMVMILALTGFFFAGLFTAKFFHITIIGDFLRNIPYKIWCLQLDQLCRELAHAVLFIDGILCCFTTTFRRFRDWILCPQAEYEEVLEDSDPVQMAMYCRSNSVEFRDGIPFPVFKSDNTQYFPNYTSDENEGSSSVMSYQLNENDAGHSQSQTKDIDVFKSSNDGFCQEKCSLFQSNQTSAVDEFDATSNDLNTSQGSEVFEVGNVERFTAISDEACMSESSLSSSSTISTETKSESDVFVFDNAEDSKNDSNSSVDVTQNSALYDGDLIRYHHIQVALRLLLDDFKSDHVLSPLVGATTKSKAKPNLKTYNSWTTPPVTPIMKVPTNTPTYIGDTTFDFEDSNQSTNSAKIIASSRGKAETFDRVVGSPKRTSSHDYLKKLGSEDSFEEPLYTYKKIYNHWTSGLDCSSVIEEIKYNKA